MSDREAFAEEKLLNTVYVGKWDELPRVNTHQCQIDIEGELLRKNENIFGDQDKFYLVLKRMCAEDHQQITDGVLDTSKQLDLVL